MNQKYLVAFALSVGLHLVIAAVMLLGEFSTPAKPKPAAVNVEMKPIEAVAIDASKLDAQVNKIKREKAQAQAREEERVKALEKRADDAKKARQKEQDRIKSLEQQRKQKESEKRKADQAAQQAKDKAAAAVKERQKKEAERKKAEQAAAAAKAKRLKEEAAEKAAKEKREKAEADRKRKEAERLKKEREEQERAIQEQLLQQQLAEEMAGRQQARRQQVMTEIGRYTALITQTIQRHLITDKSTMEGKSCKLSISLAPSGFVKNVSSGSGDRIVCDAAQKAIYKAGTLPVSKDPEVFKEMSTISLTVVPEF